MIHTTEVTLEVTSATIPYKEVTFGIDFEVSGCHRPATLTEPEEFSELSMSSIYVVAMNGKYLHGASRSYLEGLADLLKDGSWFELPPEEFDCLLENHCWDVAIDLKQANDAEACDYYDNLKEGWD